MYTKFFGLIKRPFDLKPHPGCILLTKQHSDAITALEYAITTQKGLAVLTGEVGTGKTSVISRVLNTLRGHQFEYSLVLHPTLDAYDFLEAVMLDFGITNIPESKAGRLNKLQHFLIAAHNDSKICTLIVDEAQKLSPEVLEEVRLLGNLDRGDESLLQIVLVGQNELDVVIEKPELRQFKQRIAVRVVLRPLETAEIDAYIRYRWNDAGGQGNAPFEAAAVEQVAALSRQVPRLINSLCDQSLMLAFADSAQVITADHVRTAAQELHISLHPPRGQGGRPTPPPGSSGGKRLPVRTASAIGLTGEIRAPEERMRVEPPPPPPAAVPEKAHETLRLEDIRSVGISVPRSSPVLPFDGRSGDAAIGEQYRIIRTKILQHPMKPRMIVVGSPGCGDGKSVTSMNLAGALALKATGNVLLVDADIRRPTIHTQAGLPNGLGLAEVLCGETTMEEALVNVEQLQNLYILTAGKLGANPAELLDSPQWAELCASGRASFEYVVIDSPPIDAVADYNLIEAHCDGVIVVVRPDHTKRANCFRALARVPESKLLGVVMNCVDTWFLSKTSADAIAYAR